MIRVLWFEVTRPQRYRRDARVIGGWQDSLEDLVSDSKEIELVVAFEGEPDDIETRVVDGITYVPMPVEYSFVERQRLKWTWKVNAEKLLPQMKAVVDKFKPDLIHVFGTEWPFGLVATQVNIPVVIHIQGAIVPYNNALYPPGYNSHSVKDSFPWWRIRSRLYYDLNLRKEQSRKRIEETIWKTVENYMGRTEWDWRLSAIMHPGRRYFHVDEAIRSSFMEPDTELWHFPSGKKTRLITTGCSNFWKGPDMLLKTARILTESGFDFEWNVAGRLPAELKKTVEIHEGATFEENHVSFLGFVAPDDLRELLCDSTLYVHTAYIENSPNSICEAQLLGVPVISTNVGGISSLLTSGVDGVLVPANDPWQMASTILDIAHNAKCLLAFSEASREKALIRHNNNNIIRDLLSCYHALASK